MELDKNKRKHILTIAIKEIGYTITHSSGHLNKKFRAMMHKHRAQAYDLMGNSYEAIIERQKVNLLLKKKK